MTLEKQSKDIKFHHVGIVVNTDNIKNILKVFFGDIEEHTWYNETQGVDVTFVPFGDAYLEFIYPHGNETIERFLERRGEAIHHFCFEVSDLNYWAEKCDKMNFKVVSRDHRCFFIHPKSFGGILVEFIDIKDDKYKDVSLFARDMK